VLDATSLSTSQSSLVVGVSLVNCDQADSTIHEDQLLDFPANEPTGAFDISIAGNGDIEFSKPPTDDRTEYLLADGRQLPFDD